MLITVYLRILLHINIFQGSRKNIAKEELQKTTQAIEKAHSLCVEKKGASELIADVGTLFQCIKLVWGASPQELDDVLFLNMFLGLTAPVSMKKYSS